MKNLSKPKLLKSQEYSSLILYVTNNRLSLIKEHNIASRGLILYLSSVIFLLQCNSSQLCISVPFSERCRKQSLCLLSMMNDNMCACEQRGKKVTEWDFYPHYAPTNWFCIRLPEYHTESSRPTPLQDLFKKVLVLNFFDESCPIQYNGM